MKRSFRTALLGIGLLAAAAARVHAAPVTINFRTFADGPVTTVGDATFSLAGGGETGAPYVQTAGGIYGLWNSSDGILYPTNNFLRVDFAAPVNNVTFEFDPEGFNGHPLQGWTAYDSSLAVLASGPYTNAFDDFYDLSAYSGISRIEWHNGRNDWLQSLDVLSYDNEVTSTPEPATMALLGLTGLGGLGLRLRQRRNAKNAEATA